MSFPVLTTDIRNTPSWCASYQYLKLAPASGWAFEVDTAASNSATNSLKDIASKIEVKSQTLLLLHEQGVHDRDHFRNHTIRQPDPSTTAQALCCDEGPRQ